MYGINKTDASTSACVMELLKYLIVEKKPSFQQLLQINSEVSILLGHF